MNYLTSLMIYILCFVAITATLGIRQKRQRDAKRAKKHLEKYFSD